MPIPQNFERAQLVVDGGDPIECAFNPQEYSITKTNVWTIKPVTGTDTPKPEFGGGMPWTIRVQLLLDSSLLGVDKSIKDDAIKLLKMMESGGGGGGGSAPPFVTFKWGSIESPKMVGSSLSIRFVMFRPNGEPVPRARRPRAHPVRAGAAGPEPDHARDRRPQGPHAHRRRLAAVGRLRQLRRRHPLAHDRGGERDRQPARPAPRQPAEHPDARDLMPAATSSITVSLYRVMIDGHEISAGGGRRRPHDQDHGLAPPARRVHARGRLPGVPARARRSSAWTTPSSRSAPSSR